MAQRGVNYYRGGMIERGLIKAFKMIFTYDRTYSNQILT